jgi:DDE superfamily endonuclease/Helix-turn-helix of DDE superfamily endonuclease
MITYTALANKPRIFQNFTGLAPAAFIALLPAFEHAYITLLQERDAQRPTPRRRQPGAGRHATLLTAADKLLFILFYFKFYPTQEVQGFLFGISQPQANVWIHLLTPALNRALGAAQHLPARKTRSVTQLLQACPGLEFIIDGTERPIQRPSDAERQNQCYSGKKKRHTLKNIVISEKRTKKIKALGRTRPGKTHDKSATDDEQYQFPPGSTLFKDTGFQGYEPPNITTRQPKKKPRNGNLTDEERLTNQLISRERIGVEHSIGGAKVYRIVRDVYRNHRPDYDDLVMETACGLHNLRCDVRQAA